MTHTVGDLAFAAEQERAGRFNDGRAHGYALGLQVGTYKGLREISHGGATAGYRAYLSQYPEARTSIALLCNAASVVPETYANAVAEIVLSGRMVEASQPPAVLPVPETLATLAGAYRDVDTGVPMTLTSTDTGLRMSRGPSFIATTGGRLSSPGGIVLETDAHGVRVIDSYGSITRYERVSTEPPTQAQLRTLIGAYRSDEAEIDIEVALADGNLIIKRRPNTTIPLTPAYSDAFTGSIGVIRFHRDGDRVTGFSVVQDRVWDLLFTRQAGS